jgi:hypothetical protein
MTAVGQGVCLRAVQATRRYRARGLPGMRTLMEVPMITTSYPGRVDRPSRVLMLLSLATLLWASWQRCASKHRSRLAAKPQALPEPLQTWEGEGGPPVHDLPAS